jgi:hypothetical protein
MTPEVAGPDQTVRPVVPFQPGVALQTGETARPEPSDVDLLQGLSVLADLLSNASHTLNQCLLTIEDKLSSMVIAQAEWVPIQTARSAVERIPAAEAPAREGRHQSQERMFGGVPVTIMRMAAPENEPPAAPRCEWQYELGYSVAGDKWALLIRTATYDPSNRNDSGFTYSDQMLLREAPLEIRLKAIREIPLLMRLLAEGAPQPCVEPLSEAAGAVAAEAAPAESAVLAGSSEEVTQQLPLFA